MVLVFCIGGCTLTTNSGTAVSASSSPPTVPKAASDKYSREIAKLNELVQNKSNSSATREAHLKLAQLYSDHKNNNRNYQKALEHLQAYIPQLAGIVKGN